MRWLLRLGKLTAHSALSSPEAGLFLAGEIPSGTEQCRLGGQDDKGKKRLFFLPFCAVILNFSFHFAAEVSLVDSSTL